jgi:5-deoxy-glucuronate isomerase
MSKLLIKPTEPDADKPAIHISPQTAGWTYVGFDLFRLRPGETASAETGDREVCLVFISGKGRASADGAEFGTLGGRASPFAGRPWSLYVPAGSSWSITAETDAEIAACTAPGRPGSHPPRVIGPDDVSCETRGKASNTRHVTNIISENEPADSLLVVEVITPGGCTSSYPSHKHDTDNLPHESQLEEVYYHRLDPPQGFAFQRVYTDDHGLDETMTVSDGDATLVPYGYHPCATIHGYDLYYLNVMAGPKRIWRFHNEPAHEWLLTQ